MITKTKIVIAVAALLVGATSAVAIATGSPDKNAFTPVQLAHATGAVPGESDVAGSDAGAIEQSLARRLGNPSIHAAPIAGDATSGLETDFIVDVPSAGPASIEPVWEAELLAGALRDVSNSRGTGVVANYLISIRTPDGTTQASDSGFGNVAASQVFNESAPGVMRTRIQAGAEKLGATLGSFRTVRVLQDAPVVVVSVSNPKEFVDRMQLQASWQTLLGDYNDYEGYYVEARDMSGAPVLITAVANRAGTNSSWIRPDLATRQYPTAVNNPAGG